MSRSGPAVQDETRQALDNFLGPGVAVQSMESLRKELSISSRSSLLSDILNEPKIRESSAAAQLIRLMEDEDVCASSDPIHQAWSADREASCLGQPGGAPAVVIDPVATGGTETGEAEIDATTLPYGISNLDSVAESHCELKVDNFVDDNTGGEECFYVPSGAPTPHIPAGATKEQAALIAEAMADLEGVSPRVEGEKPPLDLDDNELEVVLSESSDSEEEEVIDDLDSMPERFRHAFASFANGFPEISGEERARRMLLECDNTVSEFTENSNNISNQ